MNAFVTLLGVSNKPSLVGSSPIHFKIFTNASLASSSETAVSDEEAREAFVKILKWIGEDPTREGLLETPKRVTKAFKEYFKGYQEDPKEILSKTFGDVEGYSDMVVQKNISVQSHCEHHMAI